MNKIMTAATALLLGISSFAAFISAMSLSFTPHTMFEGGFVQGLTNVWNGIADCFGSNCYILIGKYSAAGSGQGFFLTILLVVIIVISVIVLKSGIRLLLLIYAMPFALTAFFTGIAPGLWQGITLALALMVSYIAMGSGSKSGIPLFTEIIIAFMVSAAIAVIVAGTVSFSGPAALQKTGAAVISTADHVRYGENSLHDGALNSLSGRSSSRGTALEVTMNRPESMYLRGYIGEIYIGNKWEHLGNQTYYSARDKLYWLNKAGFSGLLQMKIASELGGLENRENNVNVKVKSADRSNIYTPYELAGSLTGKTKSCADSYLASTGITGNSSYSYETADNITGSWTDWVSRLYSHKKTAAIYDYFVSESHYNVFVYEHYTGIPAATKILLKREIGRGGSKKQHIDYKAAIEDVRTYLQNNYVYSVHFSKLTDSRDFAGNFVKMRKGCDVHYATMATLIFRYYGIPARYVEGYLITPGDLKGKKAGSVISVKKNRIHAWTEIYVDGYGWVPVEVTPEYYGVMKEADLSKGLTSINYENQFKKQKNQVNGRQKSSEQNGSQNKMLLIKLLRMALLIFLVLLVAYGLYRAIRTGIEAARRRRTFKDVDKRRAVCAIYGYMIEKKLQMSPRAMEIGDYAAYSKGVVEESQRQFMLAELKRKKNESRKKKRAYARHHLGNHISSCIHRLQRKNRRKKS